MGRTEHQKHSREKLKGNFEPEVTHSIPTPEVTHLTQEVTQALGAAKGGSFSEKLKSLSIHSIHRKQALCTWIERENSMYDMKHTNQLVNNSLEFSRKLMDLAKIRKPLKRKRPAQQELPDCSHGDSAACVHRRKTAQQEEKEQDFSGRLMGLTVRKKRFDPYEHAHCCRCVQSFECFWPRPNLLTIRMQDLDRLEGHNS